MFEFIWQRAKPQKNGIQMKGVVFLAHGCGYNVKLVIILL